jgi:hypothetical protein
MPPANTSPLNSAQLSQLQSHYESQLQQVMASLNLRKWLVERILEKVTVGNVDEFVTIAEKLHSFIIAPAASPLDPPVVTE